VRIEGEYTFSGPREEVWEIVRDPEVLATAFPGTQSLNKVSESEYEVTMDLRVGPVAGVFSGRIVVSNEVPPESCTLTVEGKGAPGFATGAGDILLLAQEDGTTLIKYEGEMQIGGKLASVGQRLLDTASKSIIRQGLEALNQALLARTEAKAAGKEVEYIPPTEAEFAAGVARDMAREMLPPPRTMGLVLIVAVLALLLGFWLGRRSTESCEDHCTGWSA
jgi:carbon monoxide dehydrogenase subunit G